MNTTKAATDHMQTRRGSTMNMNFGRIGRAISMIALMAGSVPACTTSSKTRTAAEPVRNEEGHEVVVGQVGRKDLAFTQRERAYWVSMRGLKNPEQKTYGMLATGESEAAENAARAFLARNPGDADGMIMLAATLVMNRSYDLAAYYASLAERQKPGNPDALNIKGLALMLNRGARLEDFRRAAEYFRTAMNAGSRQIAPGMNLGSLWLELGNTAAAAEVFGEVVERCDRCTQGLYGYGVALSRSGRFDQAVAAFDEILKKNPNHSGALFNLALVYKNGYNKHKDAEKYLDKLLTSTRVTDVYVREKAQTVLRKIKGEASPEERSQIADAPESGDAAGEMTVTGADLEGELED